MADDLRPLRPGDDFPFSARFWNPLIRAGQEHNAGRGPRFTPPPPQQFGVEQIKNTSGADRKKFQILGFSASSLTIDDESWDTAEFVPAGVTPAFPGHLGKFCVLDDHCPDGDYGTALFAGVCLARVDIVHESHRFADVTNGDGTKLTSREFGGAEILARETGTGTKLVWVRLGAWHAPNLWGTLDAAIGAGETKVVSITNNAFSDTGRNVDAKCPWLEGSESLPLGTRVYLGVNRDAGIHEIVEAKHCL